MLPSASGAVIERSERISATFHGAIAPTTPTGWRRPIAIAPGCRTGSPRRAARRPSAAAWRRSPGMKCIWNMPKPNVQPVSRASSDRRSRRAGSRGCRPPGGRSPGARPAASAPRPGAPPPRPRSRGARPRAYPAATLDDDLARERVAVLEGARRRSAATHSPPMKSWFASALRDLRSHRLLLVPCRGQLLPFTACPGVFAIRQDTGLAMRDMQVRRRGRPDSCRLANGGQMRLTGSTAVHGVTGTGEGRARA